ncbi:MAG: rubrerythrin family protein, partial [Desulfobacteraceae bacterium]|nr:rubrerythrin family protein [Desulfobacteraceae bacterium]
MVKFRESKTAKNLHISFAAETQARTRYDFFADKAMDEGFIQIAKIFNETANQEYEHALRFFKFFNGGELEMKWVFPTGVIKDTRYNLLSAAALEKYVSEDMYAKFAIIAEEEGFERAVDTFNNIIVSEEHHRKLYLELADNIAKDKVFQKDDERVWRCLSCG